MRVNALVRIIGVTDFESPDMVTQFSPNQQIRVGQVDEVTKQGGFIEPQRDQVFGNLGVCQGRVCTAQVLQNRQAGRSAAESCRADHGADVGDFVDLIVFDHSGDFPNRLCILMIQPVIDNRSQSASGAGRSL